jgi:type II secretory pathway pseudopilin PulG
MKLFRPINSVSSDARRAFTLVEILITMVTTTMVLGAAMGAYMYGLKMVQFIQPKLSASDDARKAVSLLTEEVRTAFDVKVGNRRATTFEPIAPFTLQQGNALRIYPSTDTNQFIFYFWDVNDSTLKRTTSGTAASATVIATAVTNELVFAAEDCLGKVLDRNENNFVIAITLQFYQLQYPKVAVGPGQYYDWYQLQCRATKRTLD